MNNTDVKYDIEYCQIFYCNLIELVKSWGYDTSDLKLNINKGNVNITLNRFFFFYFPLRKTRKSINVSSSYKEILDKHNIQYIQRKSSPTFFEIAYTNDFLLIFSDFVKELYDEINMSFSGEAFSCCSRYKQCSDAKKCVSPFKDFYKYCRYRRNIEQGKIFYGKNSILRKDV